MTKQHRFSAVWPIQHSKTLWSTHSKYNKQYYYCTCILNGGNAPVAENELAPLPLWFLHPLCVSIRHTYVLTCVCTEFVNNSLGIFCHLILRGAKLEECPPRDKQWGVEGYQSLNYPPKPTGGWKLVTSFPSSHSIESQLCATAQPTVSFWHLTLGVLCLGNVQLSRGAKLIGKESKQWVCVDTSWALACSHPIVGLQATFIQLTPPVGTFEYQIPQAVDFPHGSTREGGRDSSL